MDSNWSPKTNSEGRIAFQAADISFSLKQRKAVRRWLTELGHTHGFRVANIQYIFCSDEYLLEINRSFLQHDYFTDIITFDLSEKKAELCSEIYISIPRVKDNARSFGVSFQNELHRVMAHGILHLCGFKDKTAKQEKEMRNAEDEALLMRFF